MASKEIIKFTELPEELLMNIMSFLSYRDREILAKCGFNFSEINKRLKNLEEILLIKGIVNGDCIWTSYHVNDKAESCSKMSARFLHGTSKIKEIVLIFGGASSATIASCGYNDLWKFTQGDGYERVEAQGCYPTPRANFAITQSDSHIFVSGGVFQRENSFFADNASYRDVYVYNAEKFLWTKVECEGEDPSIMFIHRASMISQKEMVVFGGGAFVYSNPKILRAINELSVLIMNDSYTEGKWIRITNWIDGVSVPARFGHHQYCIASDTILIYGGSSSGFNGCLHDAWIVKIIRGKIDNEYSARAFKLKIENPNCQINQSFLYPSCILADKLIFVGCRTNSLDTQKCDENLEKTTRRTQNQSSDSESDSVNEGAGPSKVIYIPDGNQDAPARSLGRSVTPRKIIINNQLPLNTIGAMTAFQVAPTTSPTRIQLSPRPSTSGGQQSGSGSGPSNKTINNSPENSSSEPKLRKINENRKPTDSPKKSNSKPDNLGNDRKLFLFVLDLKNVMNKTEEELSQLPAVKWLSLKNDGLLPNAPERTCYTTLTRLDNKLALIAGLQRYSGQDDSQSSIPTNTVHFIELPKYLP